MYSYLYPPLELELQLGLAQYVGDLRLSHALESCLSLSL